MLLTPRGSLLPRLQDIGPARTYEEPVAGLPANPSLYEEPAAGLPWDPSLYEVPGSAAAASRPRPAAYATHLSGQHQTYDTAPAAGRDGTAPLEPGYSALGAAHQTYDAPADARGNDGASDVYAGMYEVRDVTGKGKRRKRPQGTPPSAEARSQNGYEIPQSAAAASTADMPVHVHPVLAGYGQPTAPVASPDAADGYSAFTSTGAASSAGYAALGERRAGDGGEYAGLNHGSAA